MFQVRSRLIFALFVLMLPASWLPAAAFAKGPQQTAAPAPADEHAYALYVPEAARSAPAPLLVLLHGSGGEAAAMVRAWQPLADREGIVLFAPQAGDAHGWSLASDGPQVLCDLIEMVKEQQRIDPRRVHLFGHSGGALFALTVGLLESQYFASISAYGGTWREPREYGAAQLARRPIPVQLLLGTADPLFPLESLDATAKALEDQRMTVEIQHLGGQGHEYEPIAGRVNRLVWEFLKRQQLEAAPVYVDYPLAGKAGAR